VLTDAVLCPYVLQRQPPVDVLALDFHPVQPFLQKNWCVNIKFLEFLGPTRNRPLPSVKDPGCLSRIPGPGKNDLASPIADQDPYQITKYRGLTDWLDQ
jgi:hypothetical protein